MSSRPRRSLRLGAQALASGAVLLGAVLSVAPAYAQAHADAGAGQHAASPKEPAEHGPAGVSTLKRLPSSAQLSERVRARLEQRGSRHAAQLSQDDPAAAGAGNTGGSLGVPSDEPLRRGEARQRRVQALDTAEGVTELSNRLVLPEQRLMLTTERNARPPREPDPPLEAEEDEGALIEPTSVREETHSLRTLGARPAKLRTESAGLGWLAWPFVLLLLGGAVVGTLWFRKKTE